MRVALDRRLPLVRPAAHSTGPGRLRNDRGRRAARAGPVLRYPARRDGHPNGPAPASRTLIDRRRSARWRRAARDDRARSSTAAWVRRSHSHPAIGDDPCRRRACRADPSNDRLRTDRFRARAVAPSRIGPTWDVRRHVAACAADLPLQFLSLEGGSGYRCEPWSERD